MYSHLSISINIYNMYIPYISQHMHYTNNPILELVTYVHTSMEQEMLGNLKMRTSIPRQDWVMFSCKPLEKKGCKTPSSCSPTTLQYSTWHFISFRHITLHHNAVDTLHYITFHVVTLHYITLHVVTLRYIASHYITLHYMWLHYITLHYMTLHYFTLQYIALQ